MLDLIVALLAMTQSVLAHFITATVTVSSDYSGEWFVNLDAGLTNKGHAITGAISSIIDYGSVLLAQILAVLALSATSTGGYAGNGQLLPVGF